MANRGKFIDRSPIIRAAGKSTGQRVETVRTTLREYSLEDKVTAIKHDAKIWNEDVFVPPRKPPPFLNPQFLITNNEAKEAISPQRKTMYEQLIEELKETTYSSSWKKELGKSKNYVPGLPVGMIPETVTFGKPTERITTVKELINPPRTPYEILYDSQVGHEWYKKTHNDYNPSEKSQRSYNENFNPDKRFGTPSHYDPRGLGTLCASTWHCSEPVIAANIIQADYLNNRVPKLGMTLAPNNNINCVPKGHRFGKRTPLPLFGTAQLIKDPNVRPCLFKRDFYEWLGALNKFKLLMKKRATEGFSFDDFYKQALYFDKERTGWLPIDLFYEVCSCYRITFPKDEIEALMDYLRITVDGQIDYKRFIDLINFKKPPIDVVEFNDIPAENKYYTTSYQEANCDYLFVDNSGMPPAGTSSIRFDREKPGKPSGGCRADIDHFGDYTSANAVVNPSIYTNYGLTHRDFFLPRSAETIRTLFEKVGYNFPGDSFEKLWKEGVELDGTGLVCVDTFKTLLKTHCPSPKLLVDEQECEKY